MLGLFAEIFIFYWGLWRANSEPALVIHCFCVTYKRYFFLLVTWLGNPPPPSPTSGPFIGCICVEHSFHKLFMWPLGQQLQIHSTHYVPYSFNQWNYKKYLLCEEISGRCCRGHRHFSESAFNLQCQIDQKDQKLLRQCMCNSCHGNSVTGTKRRLNLLLSREILQKEVCLRSTVVLRLLLNVSLFYFGNTASLLSFEISLLINLSIYRISLVPIILYLPVG